MFKYLLPLENFKLKIKYDKKILFHKTDVLTWRKQNLKKNQQTENFPVNTNKLTQIKTNFYINTKFFKIKTNFSNLKFLFYKLIVNYLNKNFYFCNKIKIYTTTLKKYGLFSVNLYKFKSKLICSVKRKYFNVFFRKKPALVFIFRKKHITYFEYQNVNRLYEWLPNFNITYTKELYFKKNRKQYYFKLIFLSSTIQNLWLNFIREYLRKYKLAKKLLYWGYLNKKLKISSHKIIHFLSKRLEKERKDPINTIF